MTLFGTNEYLKLESQKMRFMVWYAINKLYYLLNITVTESYRCK